MVVPVNSIADMQSLMLAIMCNIAVMLCNRLTLATTVDSEREQVCCFVDAAASFFKLQHLHSSVPIKTQVSYLVIYDHLNILVSINDFCC